MPGLIASRLGSMTRHLCVAPSYLERRGAPATLDDLLAHETIDVPSVDARPRCWTFTKDGASRQLEITPRIVVNEALTLNKLVMNGAGIGIISGYLCGSAFASGQLVRPFPDWALPSLDVNVVFPSKRELESVTLDPC